MISHNLWKLAILFTFIILILFVPFVFKRVWSKFPGVSDRCIILLLTFQFYLEDYFLAKENCEEYFTLNKIFTKFCLCVSTIWFLQEWNCRMTSMLFGDYCHTEDHSGSSGKPAWFMSSSSQILMTKWKTLAQ